MKFFGSIVIGIILGVIAQKTHNEHLIRPIITLSSNILIVIKFITPAMILVITAIGIEQIKENKIIFLFKLLSVIVITLSILSALIVLISFTVIPIFTNDVSIEQMAFVNPYFELPLPILDQAIKIGGLAVNSSVFPLIIGVILGFFIKEGTRIYRVMKRLEKIFYFFFLKILSPVMPFWIIGSFAQTAYSNAGVDFLKSDLILTVLIMGLQIGWLILNYFVVSKVKKYNFKNIVKKGLTSYGYLFSLSGNSTGPAIPFIIERQKELGYDENKADIVTSASFNMPGSLITNIVTIIFVVAITPGFVLALPQLLPFVGILIFLTIIAPGVPGGMSALVVNNLGAYLGFTEHMTTMFMSLYYKQSTANAATNNAADFYITPWL